MEAKSRVNATIPSPPTIDVEEPKALYRRPASKSPNPRYGNPNGCRVFIYSHLVAIGLTAIVAYCDRSGGSDFVRAVFIACLPAAMLIYVYPFVLAGVLIAPKMSPRDKLFMTLVEIPAIFAHAVAGLPLVQ